MIAGVAAGLTQFFVPTHLLAVIALGLLLGQGGRHLPVNLVLLALGLVTGSIVIASAVRETPAALVLLAVAAVAGFIVVLAWVPPPYVRGVLAFFTGGAIALNAPPQALTISGAIGEQIGTAIAALLMLALVGFVTTKATRPWERIGVRVVGSWIAASAILVLALRLAR
jgi:hypothetical protein